MESWEGVEWSTESESPIVAGQGARAQTSGPTLALASLVAAHMASCASPSPAVDQAEDLELAAIAAAAELADLELAAIPPHFPSCPRR